MRLSIKRVLDAGTESALLHRCAITTIDEARSREINDLLRKPIDWSSFLQDARNHGVLPLVYESLRQADEERMPCEAMAELRSHCQAIVRENLFLSARLLHLRDQFESHRIRAIPYKGPTLASLVYGSVGLRRFGDLDFIVSEGGYAQAREFLVSQGYRPGADWGWECSLSDVRDGVAVDIHRAIAPRRFPIDLDFESLWQRMQPAEVAGREVSTLCAEDLLIVLCIQLAKDAWGRNPLTLIKICDVAETVRAHPTMDWDQVAREASRLGCRKIVGFGLRLSQELFEAPVPRLPWRTLAPRDYAALADHLGQKLLGQGSAHYAPLLGGNRFHYRIRERWRDRLHPYWIDFQAIVAPTERDREFVRLPASLSVLYFAVRPVRGLSRWFGRRRQALSRRTPDEP